MRIVVMGAGGIGAYFGAQFAAAGEDVTFIARGAQLAAIRDKGLTVESKHFPVELPPQPATGDPADLAPPDVVLFCVKLWDVETAAAAIRPLMGAGTAVVTLQNGVDAPERVARVLGRDKVIAGVAHISATLRAPGVVFHNGKLQKIVFGELGGARSPRCEAFSAACARAKIDGILSENILPAIWHKFIFLVAFSGMTTLMRTGLGPIRDDADAFALFRAAMEEARDVALAKGVAFAEEPVAVWLKAIPAMPYDFRASMLADLEQGRRLELPWLSGAVAAMGKELGVATPVNRFVATVLKPFADPGASSAARP